MPSISLDSAASLADSDHVVALMLFLVLYPLPTASPSPFGVRPAESSLRPSRNRPNAKIRLAAPQCALRSEIDPQKAPEIRVGCDG